MTGVNTSSTKWWLGLLVAIGSAILGYLAGGCTRAELSRVQTAAALRASLCLYAVAVPDARLEPVRKACARGDEVETLLRAAAQCE